MDTPITAENCLISKRKYFEIWAIRKLKLWKKEFLSDFKLNRNILI